MKTEIEIVNLFELVRKCSDEDWKYNKERLVEILEDYAQSIKRRAALENIMESVPTKNEIKQVLSGGKYIDLDSMQIDLYTLNYCIHQLHRYYQSMFDRVPEENEVGWR